jgi:signal transduction histidine kinase
MAVPLALKKGNKLVVQPGEGLGSIYADEVKLRQSLLNLLSNAAKCTENG